MSPIEPLTSSNNFTVTKSVMLLSFFAETALIGCVAAKSVKDGRRRGLVPKTVDSDW